MTGDCLLNRLQGGSFFFGSSLKQNNYNPRKKQTFNQLKGSQFKKVLEKRIINDLNRGRKGYFSGVTEKIYI